MAKTKQDWYRELDAKCCRAAEGWGQVAKQGIAMRDQDIAKAGAIDAVRSARAVIALRHSSDMETVGGR